VKPYEYNYRCRYVDMLATWDESNIKFVTDKHQSFYQCDRRTGDSVERSAYYAVTCNPLV